jgi:hypothetical protein
MPEFTEAELTAIWHVLPTDAKGSLASAVAKLDAWKQRQLAAKRLAEQDSWDRPETDC